MMNARPTIRGVPFRRSGNCEAAAAPESDAGSSALVTTQIRAAWTTMPRTALALGGTRVGPRLAPVADSQAEQTVFPDYVKELVTTEDARRASLEARGASVITSSGALVTLLFALSALVTKQQSFVLSSGPRKLLALGTVAFVLAAMLAIGTYVPRRSRLTNPVELARQLPELWKHDNDFARKKTAISRLAELADSQRVNDVKARLLVAAVVFEVIGVLLVALSVLVIL